MFNIFRRFGYCKMHPRLCGCRRSTRDALNINEITYDKLLEKVKEGAILIDVRTKQEFLEGHLDGAILIPYYEINKKIGNILPNKEQSIIVYCLNGGRSIKAGEELKKLGYKNIYNLKDGMEGIS